MAIVLKANYSKKLGLPGYSSHQYSITLRTELTDPAQVPVESSRLYAAAGVGAAEPATGMKMLERSETHFRPSSVAVRAESGNGRGSRLFYLTGDERAGRVKPAHAANQENESDQHESNV